MTATAATGIEGGKEGRKGLLRLQMPRSHVTTKLVQISIFPAAAAAVASDSPTEFHLYARLGAIGPQPLLLRRYRIGLLRESVSRSLPLFAPFGNSFRN